MSGTKENKKMDVGFWKIAAKTIPGGKAQISTLGELGDMTLIDPGRRRNQIIAGRFPERETRRKWRVLKNYLGTMRLAIAGTP
jgi:hypothetical protein